MTSLRWAYAAGSPAVLAQQRVLMVAYAVVAIAFAAAVARQLRSLRQRDAGMALGLVLVFAVALLVRLLAPASLMDLHYRLSPALAPQLSSAPYGWGLPVLAQMLWAAFGRGDQVVFTTNAVVGALAVFPLLGLAERLQVPRLARLWAIVVFALAPLHVRFSHSDNQSIVEITLLLFALTEGARFLDRGRARDGLLAGLALGIASSCRPEAIVLPAVALTLAVVVKPKDKPATMAVAGATAAYALVAGVHIVAMLHQLGSSPHGPGQWTHDAAWRAGLEHFVFLSPRWTPIAIASAVLIGAVSPEAPQRSRLWLAAMSFGLGALVWGFSAKHGGLLAARHQLRALPFAAILAGLGITLVLRSAERLAVLRHPRGTLVGSVAVMVAMILQLQAAQAPTTLNREYAFYEATITSIPDHCTVITWFPPEDRSLVPPRHLSSFAGLRHDYVDVGEPEAACATADRCFLYYRPASCFTRSPRLASSEASPSGPATLDEPCARWEADYRLTPFRTARLPAVGSGMEAFTGSPIEIGWYRPSRRRGVTPRACGDARPAREGCAWGFTPEHTEVIQRVASAAQAGGCTLRSVETSQGRSLLRWSRDTAVAGVATLAGDGCEPAGEAPVASGGSLRLTADDQLRELCPAVLDQLRAALRRGAFPQPRYVRGARP